MPILLISTVEARPTRLCQFLAGLFYQLTIFRKQLCPSVVHVLPSARSDASWHFVLMVPYMYGTQSVLSARVWARARMWCSTFSCRARASSLAASRVWSDGTQCWPSRCSCSCNAHTFLLEQTFQALDFALSSCTQQRSGSAAAKSLVQSIQSCFGCVGGVRVRPPKTWRRRRNASCLIFRRQPKSTSCNAVLVSLHVLGFFKAPIFVIFLRVLHLGGIVRTRQESSDASRCANVDHCPVCRGKFALCSLHAQRAR